MRGLAFCDPPVLPRLRENGAVPFRNPAGRGWWPACPAREGCPPPAFPRLPAARTVRVASPRTPPPARVTPCRTWPLLGRRPAQFARRRGLGPTTTEGQSGGGDAGRWTGSAAPMSDTPARSSRSPRGPTSPFGAPTRPPLSVENASTLARTGNNPTNPGQPLNSRPNGPWATPLGPLPRDRGRSRSCPRWAWRMVIRLIPTRGDEPWSAELAQSFSLVPGARSCFARFARPVIR